MRANRVAVELMRPQEGRKVRTDEQILLMDETIARLAKGNPARPLFIPNDEGIRKQWSEVAGYWREIMKPSAMRALGRPDAAYYLETLPEFVAKADTLVRMIEQDNAGKTTMLRLSQGVLAAIASAGTLAMIYLLYLWIISPVLRLRDGLQRMAAREFSTRLPVESRDEFGVLARGFNRMADELQGLYTGLEQRVEQKTAQLAAQNRDIGALYDMAAFLNQPNEIEALCDGFLRRVMLQFDAEGGSIRALDPNNEKLNLMVSVGLSDALVESEHCMRVDDCYCGVATRQAGVIVIQDFRHAPPGLDLNCQREGFASVAVFPSSRATRCWARIRCISAASASSRLPNRSCSKPGPAPGRGAGQPPPERPGAAAGGGAGARAGGAGAARQPGAGPEFPEPAIADAGRRGQARRRRRGRGNPAAAARRGRKLPGRARAADQFPQQAVAGRSIRGDRGHRGPLPPPDRHGYRAGSGRAPGRPLAPDQQLQVLFILQEALSNVRKHSRPRVRVEVEDGRDFVLDISDDGQGLRRRGSGRSWRGAWACTSCANARRGCAP